MVDRRTPIQRMIDQACGFDPNNPPPGMWPLMRCPHCGKTMRSRPAEHDPPDAAEVVCPCPDCCGETCEIEFFDKHGNRLPYHTPKEPHDD